MGDEQFPPLRIREEDADPNVIPVFQMVLSNATVERLGPGIARVSAIGISGGAPAGAPYITYSSIAGLTAELVLTAGSSITTATDGTSFYVTALTGGFATSGASYITYSSETLLSSERILTAGTGLLTATDGTSFFISLITPVVVPSGGTGASTFTNRGILIGSGTFAIEALAAMAQGDLIVGSSTVLAPRILSIGSQGQILSVDTIGSAVGLAWVNTTATIAGAGTASFYVTYIADPSLSAERTLTAGSSVTIVTDAAAIYVTAITSGLANTAMAYITYSSETLLSSERILTAGSSIITATDATSFYITALTGGWAGSGGAYITYSAETILSAERILTAGSSIVTATDATSFFISAITTNATTLAGSGLSFVTISAEAGLTSERTLAAGTGLTFTDGGAGGTAAFAMVVPVVVPSGGTGATTFTNRGVLIGSGTSAIQALAAFPRGNLLVGSDTVLAPVFLASGAAGQQLLAAPGSTVGMAWVNTAAAGGGGGGAGGIRQLYSWTIPFFVSPGTNAGAVLVGSSFVMTELLAYADTAPTTAAMFIDVNINGTSLFSNDTSKMIRIVAAANLGSSVTIDTALIVRGDRISWDVDSGSGGNSLFVAIMGS